MANSYYDGSSDKVRAQCSCEMGSIPVLKNLRIALVVELDRDGLPKQTNIVSSFTDLKLTKPGQSTGKSVVRFAKSSRKCGLSECPSRIGVDWSAQ